MNKQHSGWASFANVLPIAEHIEIPPVLSLPDTEADPPPGTEGIEVIEYDEATITLRALPEDHEDWVEITRPIEEHFRKRRVVT